MPLEYRILPEHKLAYVRGTGKIIAEDILVEGAKMFAEKEWTNGFNVLCNYCEVTEFDLGTEDMRRIVGQDKKNELLFNQSKCAVVAGSKLVFGLSRMWEALSDRIQIESMVFRNLDDALGWIGMDAGVFRSIKELP